jgi:uncharacterized protein
MFKADMYQKDIYSINYNKLKDIGIKVLLFDLDNTIIERGNYIVEKRLKELFNSLKKSFKVIIISNTWNRDKIEKIANDLGLDYIMNARKPFLSGYKKARLLSNEKNNHICMIGDQLLTDIFGAKRMGYYCCLVDPIKKKELIFTRFNRIIEYFLYKKLNKKYGIKRGSYYD